MNTVDPVLLLRAAHQGHTAEEMADLIGCSRQYLQAVLKGEKHPGPVILDFLGLAREWHYTRADKRNG